MEASEFVDGLKQLQAVTKEQFKALYPSRSEDYKDIRFKLLKRDPVGFCIDGIDLENLSKLISSINL